MGQQEAGPARAGLFVFGGWGIAADISRSGCLEKGVRRSSWVGRVRTGRVLLGPVTLVRLGYATKKISTSKNHPQRQIPARKTR